MPEQEREMTIEELLELQDSITADLARRDPDGKVASAYKAARDPVGIQSRAYQAALKDKRHNPVEVQAKAASALTQAGAYRR